MVPSYSFNNSSRLSIDSMSKKFVGSSNMRKLFSETKILASETFTRSPPLKSFIRFSNHHVYSNIYYKNNECYK